VEHLVVLLRKRDALAHELLELADFLVHAFIITRQNVLHFVHACV
jgi:hypothetical protein